jgi:hypothetical protein
MKYVFVCPKITVEVFMHGLTNLPQRPSVQHRPLMVETFDLTKGSECDIHMNLFHNFA